MDDKTLRAFMEYQKHSSIIAIQNQFKNRDINEAKDIEKEIQNLNTMKACQYSDIPTKIIDIHLEFFCKSMNI